ncbi:MAG: serine/threonine-protein kinase [Nitrospirota bacterium]
MPKHIKDEYEIVNEIGIGGMAIVYKAVQKSLDRLVAIKELKKSYHADGQIVRRFERESKVAASLQHENIVHIYDYWKKPTYCIVMEYVDGTDLCHIIEKTGPLPVEIGIMIALQICSALEYAHMRGLIHRDIKPGNIMIKRNGEVKLMDFGIAHTRNLESLTLPGTLIGTPAYMSPEQVLGQQLDARSDIFSLGIVLYEMFTGVKPFQDEETRAVSAKIVKDRVSPPRRINKNVPWTLQRIIKRCLKKKPNRRYGSMLEIEKKLGRRLAGKTTKASSLRRISDYLVEVNVFEAVSDHDTVAVPNNYSRKLSLKKVLIAASAIIILAAAGAWHYYHSTAENIPMRNDFSSPTVTKPSTTQQALSQSTLTFSQITTTMPSLSLAPVKEVASQATSTRP